MKKTYVAIIIAILLIAGVRHLVRTPTSSPVYTADSATLKEQKTTLEMTLDDLDSVVGLLKSKGSKDELLMRFVAEYQQVSKSHDELDRSLQKLQGLKIDLIPMVHNAPNISEEGKVNVANLQSLITEHCKSRYSFFWAEDFTGGQCVTRENSWKEVLVELKNTTIPLKNNDMSRDACMELQKEYLPFSAGVQLVMNQDQVKVMGGDYRPLKNIQQRIMEYPILREFFSTDPSAIHNEELPMIREVLSRGRDLYLLSYIAEHQSAQPQVIVFGVAHTEHLMTLLKHYGAVGETVIFTEE
jgi:hypothetical protein